MNQTMNNECENLPACFLVFDVTGNWDITSLRLRNPYLFGTKFKLRGGKKQEVYIFLKMNFIQNFC